MTWFSKKVVHGKRRGQVKVLQITDLHMFASKTDSYFAISPNARLNQLLSHIKREHADLDLLVITGDITQDHSDASYQALVSEIEQTNLAVPVVWCPGNHDDIAMMEQAFINAPFFQEKFITLGSWQIALCNSKSDTPAGFVAQQHIDELKQLLTTERAQKSQQSEDHHVAIFCHHHPLEVDGYLDKHGFENGQDWMAQLAEHEEVCFVAHGHVHNEYQLTFSGPHKEIPVYACPATCAQFKKYTKDWQVDTQYIGYRQFNLYDDGHFTTQVTWLKGV